MKKWTFRIVIPLVLGAVTTFLLAFLAHRLTAPVTFAMMDFDPTTLDWVQHSTGPSTTPVDVSLPNRALRKQLVDSINLQALLNERLQLSPLRERTPDGYRRLISMIWLEGPAADWAAGRAILSQDIDSQRWRIRDIGIVDYALRIPVDGSVLMKRTGWPWRVFEFRIYQRFATDPNGFVTALSNLEASGGNPVVMQSELDQSGIDSMLPIRMFMVGTALNTLIFGAGWFAVLFAPGIVRRSIRRWRGRCPMCAYDLRGALDDGCTECGWNREQAEKPA